MIHFVPKKYTGLVFAFYMAALMALIMSACIVGWNTGFSSGYLARVAHSYLFAMPVAFCSVLAVRPLVMKLVGLTVAE